MKDRYLDGLALGLLLGFAISTGSLWLIDSTNGVVRAFFDDHLTHFFTLTAAGFALWGVSRQVQSNVELAERQRKAKLEAACSSLPIVLSNIHEICEARLDAVVSGNKAPSNEKHWEITEFELSTLRSCIEHADGTEKEMMKQIIRVYQVLIDRWAELELIDLFSASVFSKDDYRLIEIHKQYYSMIDWMALRATADALFNYSRGEYSNPDKAKMKESVFFALRHVGSGTLRTGGGWLLSNNSNYSDFIERQMQRNHVSFIDGGWT